MMESVLDIASRISTPLALAGLFAAIVLLVFRQIVARNIFPNLTTAAGAAIIRLIIDRLFILALVAMTLGFAGWIFAAVYSAPDTGPTAEERRVLELRQSVVDLRGTWESIVNPKSYPQQEVLRKAKQLGDDLELVPDSALAEGLLITKHQFASLAYAMAADVEADSAKSLQLADKAVAKGEEALAVARRVRTDSTRSEAAADTADWLSESNVEDNAYYVIGVAHAIRARRGAPDGQASVGVALEKINAAFLERYPVNENPVLCRAVPPGTCPGDKE